MLLTLGRMEFITVVLPQHQQCGGVTSGSEINNWYLIAHLIIDRPSVYFVILLLSIWRSVV
jgi:hypothetical protein